MVNVPRYFERELQAGVYLKLSLQLSLLISIILSCILLVINHINNLGFLKGKKDENYN